MAEGNLKGVVTTDEQLLDGHKVIYKFKVHHLDVIQRTFYPLEYATQCLVIPTTWEIEIKYERMQDVYGSYTFSVKLKRKDPSDHRMKATVFVLFYDVNGAPVTFPISSSKGRMVHDDELLGILEGILPSILRQVVTVEVTIGIQNCHQGTYQCASKLDADKSSINLSKL